VLGIEIAAFAALLGLHWLLSILAHRKLLENALSQVSFAIENLDQALGEAIEMVSTRSTEGQNPLVGVLSQILMKNLEPPGSEMKVIQGSDGKFQKKEP
tara:strand:- start:2732 stop:3028 length:297 start_codon:yes stop_codon:yes gene_type:complete